MIVKKIFYRIIQSLIMFTRYNRILNLNLLLFLGLLLLIILLLLDIYLQLDW